MAQKVTAPRRQAREGGIKSIIGEFVREDRLVLAGGAGGLVWEDTGCGLPATTKAGCFDEVTAQADKVGTGPVVYEAGTVFALYKGVECHIGGDADGATFQAQAEAVLLAGEDRLVEGKLASWASGGAVTTRPSLAIAIATADQIADSLYVGRPVMLMSRYDADLAFGQGLLVFRDGILVTANGTPVIANGLMAINAVAVLGWPEVYATTVRGYTTNDLPNNKTFAIAERLYSIGVDCDFRTVVTVTAP